MNQAQLKYARQRAEKIYVQKRQEIENAYTDEAVTLSTLEKVEAIKAGRIEVSDTGRSGHYWAYDIKFLDERPRVLHQEHAQPELDTLKKNYAKLMDELMLGDNEEALALLKAFEAL